MMKRMSAELARRIVPLVVVAAAALAGPAFAQDVTVYGTAGLDGNQTNIQLLGATARFGGLGLAPEVALQGYHLGYDTGTTGNASVWAVTPSAGASFRTPVGQVGARVGYSFQNKDVATPIIEGEGGGSGVVVSGQGNYWGPGPELQGIVSYSAGSEYVWTQAQALVKVLPLPAASVRVGPEVTWQGSTQSGGGSAIQLGPVVKVGLPGNFSVNAGGGWKHFGGSSTSDDTWYARVGFVKYGIHL